MPTRLNLICHGMILFVEESAQTLSICVPIAGPHEHLYGTLSHASPSKATLQGLPRGKFLLGGVMAKSAPLASLFGHNNYVILRKSAVGLDRTKLEAESAIITVPKPSLVRFYRPSEPSINVFGSTPISVAHGVPAVVHDVVVLSYLLIPDGTSFSISGQGLDLFSAVAAPDVTINWSVYSTDSQAPAVVGAGHPTTLNDYLTDRVTTRPTSLILSAIGVKDGPPETGIGIAPEHTADLQDLKTAPAAPALALVCGRLGCTGAAYAD